MEIKVRFSPCDKVYYFNTAECKVVKEEIKSARVIPVAVSKTEAGENKLDKYVVLYETAQGPVLADSECFATKEECVAFFKEFFGREER